MSDDLLRLKWNLHDSNFLDSFKAQRSQPEYADVTLVTEGKFFKAHKFVLGLCSDYFKQIFDVVVSTSPVVILQDISVHILEYILDYMYIGEVNIPRDQIIFLLKAAEALKIKGLVTAQQEMLNEMRENEASNTIDEPPKKKSKVESNKNSFSSIVLKNQPLVTTSLLEEENPLLPIVKMEANDENVPLQIDTSSNQASPNSNDGQGNSRDSNGMGPSASTKGDDEVNMNGNRLIGVVSGTGRPVSKEAACDRCNMVLSNQNLLRRHIEDHHLHIRKYYCVHCSKSFKRKEHKERHERIHTGEKPFICSFCSSRFTQKEHLKGHVENVHMKHGKTDNIRIPDARLETKMFNKLVENADSDSTLPVLAPASLLSNLSSRESFSSPLEGILQASSSNSENKCKEKSSKGDSTASAVYVPYTRNTTDSPSDSLQRLNFNFP